MAVRPALSDPGAQGERTLLAWQRTSLLLSGCVAALVRINALHSLPAAVLTAALAAPTIGIMVLSARYRYGRATQVLDVRGTAERGVYPLPSGWLPFLLASAGSLLGAVELWTAISA
ncbi:DUF202 domain-containing protein [Nocardia fluminea]|uniref:DUF202 domain-containing protein n=1 Tax=Nocardia fluminea TaxID=134984 RepID=UPI003672DA93